MIRQLCTARALGSFAVVLFNDCVALARELLEFLAVYNFYSAARVPDYLLSLQDAGSNRHTRPIRAQHDREEIVCDRHDIGVDSVLGHQQPSRQAFLDLVMSIASGSLGYLYLQSSGITAQNCLKQWCRW